MLGCAHEYVRQKVRQNGQNLRYLVYNMLVINNIKINIYILRRFAVKQKCSLSEHLYFFGTLIIGWKIHSYLPPSVHFKVIP